MASPCDSDDPILVPPTPKPVALDVSTSLGSSSSSDVLVSYAKTYPLQSSQNFFLISMQVHVNYSKQPRKYVLTPTHKKVGKAVARGSKQGIASECPVTRKYIIQKVGVQLGKELATMCFDKTNSILRQQSMDSLDTFSWGKLYDEMEVITPLLISLLRACTYTRKPRRNRMVVVGM